MPVECATGGSPPRERRMEEESREKWSQRLLSVLEECAHEYQVAHKQETQSFQTILQRQRRHLERLEVVVKQGKEGSGHSRYIVLFFFKQALFHESKRALVYSGHIA